MPYVLATCSLSAYHIWSVFLLFIISLTSYLTLKISGAWKLDCAPHVWKLGYDFLFALHSNCGPILYHFRDKEWYRSKIAIFHTQPAFDATVRRSPSEYCRMVWCGKTRNTTVKTVWEYDYSFRHNTRTWRTDGQTPHDGLAAVAWQWSPCFFTGHKLRPPGVGTEASAARLLSDLHHHLTPLNIPVRALIGFQFVIGYVHRVSKKTVHFCFCQNFVKFPPTLISFGEYMAKWLKL